MGPVAKIGHQESLDGTLRVRPHWVQYLDYGIQYLDIAYMQYPDIGYGYPDFGPNADAL